MKIQEENRKKKASTLYFEHTHLYFWNCSVKCSVSFRKMLMKVVKFEFQSIFCDLGKGGNEEESFGRDRSDQSSGNPEDIRAGEGRRRKKEKRDERKGGERKEKQRRRGKRKRETKTG